MHECCKQLNIPPYSASNLRDTHMTKTREFKMQNSLSDMEHAVLTDHTTKDLDLQHYVDISIKTIMEAMHGVIIGNVDLNGEIVEDTKISRSIQDGIMSKLQSKGCSPTPARRHRKTTIICCFT